MTITIQAWEVALLIMAIALVVGTVYLVKVLKELAETVKTVDRLIDENRMQIHGILNEVESIGKNTNGITNSANNLTSDIEETVNGVKSSVLGTVAGVASTATGILSGGSRTKQSREIRKLKKNQKDMAKQMRKKA